MRSNRTIPVIGGALFALPDIALAQRLAGGGATDVSIIRVAAALAVCIAAAFGLAVLLRNRMAQGSGWRMSGFLTKLKQERRLTAVEVLRISPQAELALVACDGIEYLLFYGAAGVEVLSRRESVAPVEHSEID
jgi:hypothetical protein